MARETYTLTMDPDHVCSVIDQHMVREESRLTARWLTWKLAYHYLQGARRFDVFDPRTGRISAHMVDDEGNMEFQSQELLGMIDRVSSQLSAMDVRPMISRAGSSLSSIRQRSIAQVMANSLVNRETVEDVNSMFAFTLTTLGCCGITGHIEDHPTIGLTADYEMVHPRELFPFPSLGQDYSKQRGLVRRRTVPMDWLKGIFGRRIESNKQKMHWWESQPGEIPHHDTTGEFGAGTGYREAGTGGGRGPAGWDSKEHAMGMARIEEVWLYGHRNLVSRYIIKSGQYVIYDSRREYEDLEVYCPIGVARFMENGTFHGSGLFDLLFSLHRQMELLLKSLFNNIRDTDQYGVVVLPSGQFNHRTALQPIGRGLQALTWEPDVVDSGFRPFNIAPFNTGDVPGKTASFAREMFSSLSPWQDLLREKGRVDSGSGLGFLDEKIRGRMSNPTRALDRAWSQAHRAMLAGAARQISESRRAMPVHELSLELAGAVIDMEREIVTFDENPLPQISGMGVTIRETNPTSPVVRKQEALELYGMPGFDDPKRFMLLALKEGLDFALYMEGEKNAYESIVRSILVLFGNGTDPGELILTPDSVMPDIQLEVLSSFMSSPIFSDASPEVKDEFGRLREFLISSSGMALPEAVPNPDDLAALMQPQAGPQGMTAGMPALM